MAGVLEHLYMSYKMAFDKFELDRYPVVPWLHSSNGLVCISPVDAKLVITNPLTKELIKLPKFMSISRDSLCWGFGYDSSVDDYKVIVGLEIYDAPTRFVMFTLKTNTWKQIGVVNYRNIGSRSAMLCNGALHRFMKTTNCRNNENKVILSFDLILNEFKEIPQPDDNNISLVYKSDGYHKTLGSINGCLCICDGQRPFHMWVMKNYNEKESWEGFPWESGEFRAKSYRFLHQVKLVGDIVSYEITSTLVWDYVRDPIFLQTLVSPRHYYNGRPGQKGVQGS
uniref:F-box/kelch-repeat protein At3g06240-like n=1 Tax=Erigeron canadensis TaxID=72917 RepID=UPI001CB96632|nr:F-box/kelch-repeat protein At3g06240-like [Erigeron canadensis]